MTEQDSMQTLLDNFSKLCEQLAKAGQNELLAADKYNEACQVTARLIQVADISLQNQWDILLKITELEEQYDHTPAGPVIEQLWCGVVPLMPPKLAQEAQAA